MTYDYQWNQRLLNKNNDVYESVGLPDLQLGQFSQPVVPLVVHELPLVVPKKKLN